MSIDRRGAAGGFIALAMLCALASRAFAQEGWPDRQLSIIVPYPPGGYIDAVTRIVADGFRERTGQIAVIFNKPGANGQMGLADLARAEPDGATLLTNNDGGLGLPPAVDPTFRFNPATDYTPVAQLVEADYVVTVRDGLPVRSIAELIAYAKSRPEPLTYASPGVGSTPHVGMADFARRADVTMVHVPYTGSAPAISDVLAGHVDIYLASLPTVLALVRADRLRALAVLGEARAADLPDLPTMAESGVADFVLDGWLRLFAPPKLPPALGARIGGVFTAVARQPRVAEKLRQIGASPITKDAAAFAPFYQAEVARWRRFSEATRITAAP